MSDSIDCYLWNNEQQDFLFVGEIIHDEDYNNGRGLTGFEYDKDYFVQQLNELDPKHLSNKLIGGALTVPLSGGVLPHYFQQFLPGYFADQLFSASSSNWDTFNQYEKLSKVTRFYGDYHALRLRNGNPQIDTDIESFDVVSDVSKILQSFIKDSTKARIEPSTFAAISNLSGKRPKIDYFDKEQKRRYIVKLNDSGYYNDAKIANFMNDLESNCGIATTYNEFRESNLGDPLLLQQNFSNTVEVKEGQKRTILNNQVSFKVLVAEKNKLSFNRRITYEDISNAIQLYSSRPEDDLEELYRRAYFSASVNHTGNGLENLTMSDIGVNEWRLSPSFHNLPTPHNSSEFSVAFDETLVARNLFNLDEAFTKRLSKSVGISVDKGLEIKKEIDSVLSEAPSLIAKHNLSKDDVAVLASAMPDVEFGKTLTKSKSPTGPSR